MREVRLDAEKIKEFKGKKKLKELFEVCDHETLTVFDRSLLRTAEDLTLKRHNMPLFDFVLIQTQLNLVPIRDIEAKYTEGSNIIIRKGLADQLHLTPDLLEKAITLVGLPVPPMEIITKAIEAEERNKHTFASKPLASSSKADREYHRNQPVNK